MQLVEHSKSCVKWHFEFWQWQNNWPQSCPKCGAWGSWSTPGSRLDPPDGGACSCVEAMICPRCGSEDWTMLIEYQHCDYLICFGCGWDERLVLQLDNHSFPGLAVLQEQMVSIPVPECYCWEEQQMQESDDLD